MLVDDKDYLVSAKLAKEKLAREFEKAWLNDQVWVIDTEAVNKYAQWIRNTDLTDCQPGKWCNYCRKDNHNDSECWSTRPANWKPSEGLVNVFGNPIAPAPDQGSVRNATDIERCAKLASDKKKDHDGWLSTEGWNAACVAIEDAIRALPDQKD